MQSSMRKSAKRRSNMMTSGETERDKADDDKQESAAQDHMRSSNGDNVNQDILNSDGERLQPLREELYKFHLQQERYLEGQDTRCVMQFDEEKFVACVWGTSEIFIIDREKPEAVNSFETSVGVNN